MSWFTSRRLVAGLAVVLLPVLGLFLDRVVLPLARPVLYDFLEQCCGYQPSAQVTQPQIIQPHVTLTSAASFQVNFLYRPTTGGPLRPILPGSVLHSGDRYKVVFTPPRDGFVHLFQVDSAGNFFQLFPMTEFRGVKLNNTNPVHAGRTYTLPGPDKSYQLDAAVGRERILLVFADESNTELDSLATKIDSARTTKNTVAQASANGALAAHLSNSFSYRGLASVESDETLKLTWDSSGEVFEALGRRLENLCNDCVYGIEFQHQ